MNDEKEYYTVYEMAERSGVTPKTMYTWIQEKGLKSYTMTHGARTTTMLRQDDVDDFLRPEILEAARDFE